MGINTYSIHKTTGTAHAIPERHPFFEHLDAYVNDPVTPRYAHTHYMYYIYLQAFMD